jgi:hypothetical protein
MRAAATAISYRYDELPAGARLTIAATTPAALAAIHELLRFQIADHETGDPLEARH